jgi:hypothetical protein
METYERHCSKPNGTCLREDERLVVQSRSSLIRLSRAVLPHRIATHLNAKGVVNEPRRRQDGPMELSTLDRGLRRVAKTPETLFRPGERVWWRG